MSKKIFVVTALVGMCALSLFLVNCGGSSSRPSGVLYAVSQQANNITSYSLDLASGNLSLINSNANTCAAQATCGLPLTLSLDSTSKAAFLLNQSSISGFTVNSDGSLSAPTNVATFPAGQTALAMARDTAGDLLFVISVGASSPTDCPTSQGTFGEDCPNILVFTTQPGSTTATLATTFPLSRVPSALSAATYTSSSGSPTTVLFVTSVQDLTNRNNNSELSVYAVDSSGNLTESPESPYTTQVDPTAVIAVNTNQPSQNTGGVFVYVGNQGDTVGGLSTFSLCTQVNNGAEPCSAGDITNNLLYPVGKTLTIGQSPTAMIVDPTNTFLYVACNVGNVVDGFRITIGTGSLTSLSPASEPTTSPVAMAMHPNSTDSNEFLFVSNNALNTSTISGFTLNVTTGAMSNPIAPVIFTEGEPYGLAAY